MYFRLTLANYICGRVSSKIDKVSCQAKTTKRLRIEIIYLVDICFLVSYLRCFIPAWKMRPKYSMVVCHR